MPTDPIDPATAQPNPEDGNEDSAALDTSSESVSPPDARPAPTGQMPDAAYKGIQRELDKANRRLKDAEARIQQMQSSQTGGREIDPAMASALIAEIRKTDPARADLVQREYEKYLLTEENVQLRNQQAQSDLERQLTAIEARNVEELRATARAFGMDPDSALLDYGDPSESIADRLARVREIASTAMKPATPVIPPTRSVADGTTHNTQAGTPPPPPASRNAPVTEAEVQAAQAAYARAAQSPDPEVRRKAERHMREVTERFAAQVFA